MKSNRVIIERDFQSPVEKVWEALTDKNKMQEWYFKLDAFRPEKGFRFSFGGEGSAGDHYQHICEITEVIPFKKLQYSWAYQNRPGYSIVTFELSPLSGDEHSTHLRLTHEGLDSFPQDSSDFSIDSFTAGWTALIGDSLKKFLSLQQ
jgi:uncharacterized protein YndB with AHSA1/START domain